MLKRNSLALVLFVFSMTSLLTLLYVSFTIKIGGSSRSVKKAEVHVYFRMSDVNHDFKVLAYTSRRFPMSEWIPETEQNERNTNKEKQLKETGMKRKLNKFSGKAKEDKTKTNKNDEKGEIMTKIGKSKYGVMKSISKLTNHKQGYNEPMNEKKTESRQKYLIYQCDASYICGGWGDRQRSIVSTYHLSQIINRTFGINVTSPCNIRELYVPNKVNWVIDPAEIKGLTTETVFGIDNHFSPKDFHKLYTADVIYLRTNRDLFYSIREDETYSKLMPKWAKGQGLSKAFRNGWNILMKYRDHVMKQIEAFLTKVPKNDLVCAHIRVGRSKNSSLKDTRIINKMSDVEMIWNFLDPYVANASKLFIAADSEEVRKIARDRYKEKEIDVGGALVHVDLQRDSADVCHGLVLALIDQAVLGMCRVLVLSQSNFSQRAAMLGDLRGNLFMWDKGTITKYNLV